MTTQETSIKYHCATEADECIIIQPGARNTDTNPVQYIISGIDYSSNIGSNPVTELELLFQNGPVVGGKPNGLTIEALLAVCKHRLEAFQSGPYASPHNDRALIYIDQALGSLHARTRSRQAAGIEGTMVAAASETELPQQLQEFVSSLKFNYPAAMSTEDLLEDDLADIVISRFLQRSWDINTDRVESVLIYGTEAIQPLDMFVFDTAQELQDYLRLVCEHVAKGP